MTTVAGAAPSKEDVERARERLEAIEDKLSGIQGQLAATQERLNAATVLTLLLALLMIAAGTPVPTAAATLTVTSPTLKANETVPVDHTADGRNVSPALNWTGAPAGTKQFALIYDDPDVAFPSPAQPV